MARWDEGDFDYMQEAAMERFLEASLRNISVDNAKSYLGTYGDAIQDRVASCLRQARVLHNAQHYAPALVLASTAVELTVRFMIVRPLIQGAFLSDEWAAILANRIANGRTAEDRELLPAVLRQWSVDINKVKLHNGQNVWSTIVGKIWPKRNLVVHQGTSASEVEAAVSVEAAELLLTDVVKPIAKRLGFTLETTGKWSEILGEKDDRESGRHATWGQSFKPESPFSDV